MIGAPALVCTAALRAGAGLGKIIAPETILSEALTICPSATGVPLAVDRETGEVVPHLAAQTLDRVMESATALAVGPGLGTSEGARAITLRVIQQEKLPVVIDADALNCMSAMPELFRDLHAAAMLTPHPGEFKRLCAGLGLKDNLGLDQSREGACERLAQRLGRVVVLKGASTVVSDGLRTWTCRAGHPCLGTAGTGDVLTGVLAGLIAQFCPTPDRMLMRVKAPAMSADPLRPLDLFDAARVGVWIHATAGEAWARQHGASGGLLAVELAGLAPGVVELLRAGSSQ